MFEKNNAMQRKMIIGLIGVLCMISCSEESFYEERGDITKRIEINLTGDLQNIVPWSRFSIYTEDNTSFNYINNGDTIFVKYGLYQSVDTDFFYNPIIFERKYKYDVSNFHFAITYLKRCSKPSEADNLIVNIKAFETGELYKEENCIMRAYQISERPSSDEYIYRFIF